MFLSRRGSYLGHALAAAGQHRISPAARPARGRRRRLAGVPFGRAVVDAKVRKQMILLQRLARRDNAEVIRTRSGRWTSCWSCCPTAGPATS